MKTHKNVSTSKRRTVSSVSDVGHKLVARWVGKEFFFPYHKRLCMVLTMEIKGQCLLLRNKILPTVA